MEPVASNPIVEFYKRDIDRALIRENLKLNVTQRLEKLMAMQRLAEAADEAGRDCELADSVRMVFGD